MADQDLCHDLQDVVCFIEADTFAQGALHYMHVESPINKTPLQWEHIPKGHWKTLSDGVTSVSFHFARIQGSKICFYTATSVRVDWEIVENFLNETCPGVPQTDAQNFEKCIH